MDDSSKFISDLKQVRKRLGLSQEQLAQALGVSFATVNRWENEKTSPSKLAVKTFERFCAEMKHEGKLDV